MVNLRSNRFAGDSDLTNVLNSALRLAVAGTSSFPAPVLSSGPTIVKVQQALLDIGYSLPQFGADGTFGSETGTAVVAFKSDWHLVPRDPVIGPKTMLALDKEMVALERRASPVPLRHPPHRQRPIPSAARNQDWLKSLPPSLVRPHSGRRALGALGHTSPDPWSRPASPNA